MNHVDEEHLPGCVGLFTCFFNGPHHAETALGITRDHAVDVHVVGEGDSVFDEGVEIEDCSVDLNA